MKNLSPKTLMLIGKIIGGLMIGIPGLVLLICLIVGIRNSFESTAGLIGTILIGIIAIRCIGFGMDLLRYNSEGRDYQAYIHSARFKLTIAGFVLVILGGLLLPFGVAADAESAGIVAIIMLVVGTVQLFRLKYYCPYCGARLYRGEMTDFDYSVDDVHVNDNGDVSYKSTTEKTYRYHCSNCDYWAEIKHTHRDQH